MQIVDALLKVLEPAALLLRGLLFISDAKCIARTLPEYKEQINPKRLRAEAPWERCTSGSQVTAYQHSP